MEVTDVQGDAYQRVRVSICICLCVSGKPSVLFWEEIFPLMKLDLPVDENVHLNVSPHISWPPVRYGDSVESFRCQPSFYIFTLVMNGTSLCLLSRRRPGRSESTVREGDPRDHCKKKVFLVQIS